MGSSYPFVVVVRFFRALPDDAVTRDEILAYTRTQKVDDLAVDEVLEHMVATDLLGRCGRGAAYFVPKPSFLPVVAEQERVRRLLKVLVGAIALAWIALFVHGALGVAGAAPAFPGVPLLVSSVSAAGGAALSWYMRVLPYARRLLLLLAAAWILLLVIFPNVCTWIG